jgi:hypothetical protein
MWLTAGMARYRMHQKNDEIWFTENHTSNPLAPIEIDVPEATTEKHAELYALVYSTLAYLEFMRAWRDTHKLSETLEKLREDEEAEWAKND